MASQPGYFNVQEFADAGLPLVGGRLYTYIYGTTTQKTTYTDAAGVVPQTYTSDGLGGQYIALNSRGELPAPLYLADGPYDLALKRLDGSSVWTRRAEGYNAPVTALSTAFAAATGSGLMGHSGIVSYTLGTVGATLNDSSLNARMFPWLAQGDGATDDTSALNAFLLVAKRGHIPAGTYKITGPLNFQSNQVITGDGPATIIKYQASGPAAGAPVLDFTNKSHTRVSGLTLQVNTTTYPAARTILMDTSTDCHASEILFTGGAGCNVAYLTSATRCSISKCYVDDYRGNGFYVNGGFGNVIEDNDIPDGSGGLMGIQLVGGESNSARRNRIALTPDNYFGIHAYGGNFPVVDGNVVKNTRREAIALGGGTQIGARVVNNTMYWDANLGIGDFGMSVAGDDGSNIVADFLIEGNTIMSAALDGIGIAGWCQRGRVANNMIRDCARASAGGHQSGIKLYGWIAGAVVNDMTIEGNSITKLLGGMLYAVSEDNSLGVASGNIIRGNKSYGLSGEIYRRKEGPRLMTEDHDAELWRRSFALRMDAFEHKLEENTESTQRVEDSTKELVAILNSWKGAIQVLEFLGKIAKPVAAIAAVMGAIFAWRSQK
jgi:hypothetical protein